MRTILTAAAMVAMLAGSVMAAPDNRGVDDNQGTGNDPQGRSGQKGQPGQEGVTGPLIELPAEFVIAQGYDKDSPTDGNQGQGNDPGKSGKAPGHDKR